MTHRAGILLTLVLTVTPLIGCGKKNPPQPPLRPVPAMVSGFTVDRTGVTVTVRFAAPTTNADQGTPPATDSIDVYAITLPASAPAPTMEQLAAPGNVVNTVPVIRQDERNQPAGSRGVRAGEAAAYVDKISVPADGGPFVRYYAVAGWAGRRRGVVAPMLTVPLGTGPAAPAAVTPEYDESAITLVWQAVGAGQRFVVDRVGAAGESVRITPEPVAATQVTAPVQFGVEQCFVVRTVDVIGAVTLTGEPTPPACVTPIDRFPPLPPSGLKGFPAATGIELTWTAPAAADVAGYVILRGDGTSDTLQRLTAAPVTATQYRDEAVRSGATYTYAVIAIDRATPPNESRQSNRDTVTARQNQRP